MKCGTCGYEFDPERGLECPRCGESFDCTGISCAECGACSGILPGLGGAGDGENT
ncbi:MAG: hypothetical protein V5A23_02960 [Halobacteriales archaeon]